MHYITAMVGNASPSTPWQGGISDGGPGAQRRSICGRHDCGEHTDAGERSHGFGVAPIAFIGSFGTSAWEGHLLYKKSR